MKDSQLEYAAVKEWGRFAAMLFGGKSLFYTVVVRTHLY